MKTILVDAVNAFVIVDHGIFKEMHDLLEQYLNQKIILTGANKESQAKFGFANAPYEVFSLNHNPEKSDPMYYQTMLKHFKLAPDDVIYFEHNRAAVESARSIGINTYYYDKDKKDLVGLKDYLDKNL